MSASGANVGDARGDADRGGPGARRAPRHAPARGLAPLRDRTGRRHRPARVPQRRGRARRPGRTGSGAWVGRAPVRAQDARARVRASGARALGPARARSRPAGLRAWPRQHRAPDRRPDRPMPTIDPAKAAKLLEVPHPEAAARVSSCSRRWPTSPRASSRRAGARPSRRRGAARSGSRVRTRSARSASGTRVAAGGDRGAARPPGSLSPGSASAAPSRWRRRPVRARPGTPGRPAATRRPRQAPCRGRRARRHRRRHSRPGSRPRR